MNSKSIIENAMSCRGYTQNHLAKKLGFNTTSGVSEKLRRKQGMRIDTFVKFLNAMDFEVVVRSTTTSKEEWVVELE